MYLRRAPFRHVTLTNADPCRFPQERKLPLRGTPRSFLVFFKNNFTRQRATWESLPDLRATACSVVLFYFLVCSRSSTFTANSLEPGNPIAGLWP